MRKVYSDAQLKEVMPSNLRTKLTSVVLGDNQPYEDTTDLSNFLKSDWEWFVVNADKSEFTAVGKRFRDWLLDNFEEIPKND